ncbi:MAG: threonine synthase, partial [Chloroflexota bacterium]|nr:threonine synthase [Chloroflexota bacterium]
MGAGVLNTYPDLLPVTSATPIITMGEGDTPLVRSNRLGRELGCTELYFKLEGCNPTGSFKDRGMVMAIAKALEEGTKAIMCASTGNTSASAAAFGAYCDIPTFVLIPKGEVAMGKLAQAMIYGAKVIMINGNFDAALGMVREFTQRNDVTLVNSVNPHRIEGQKTAAFEIVDKLGGAPDMLFIPVGNAGNITAYWKGFREYQDLGRSQALPRMMGFQAEGAAPIVRGEPVARPQTIASAIRIGNPATWNGAIEARDGSGGVIDAVSDDEILEAYRLLANKEGIFCEPASAASFAGLLKMHRQGMDLSDKRIVCICTGNGLKDPDLAVSSSGGQTIEVPANIEALEAVTI